MVKMNKDTLTLHTLGSGIVAFFYVTFMASGTIAENYTEKTFVAPEFFLILVFWLIGVLFLLLRKYRISVWIMWISIPLGALIAFPFAAFL